MNFIASTPHCTQNMMEAKPEDLPESALQFDREFLLVHIELLWETDAWMTLESRSVPCFSRLVSPCRSVQVFSQCIFGSGFKSLFRRSAPCLGIDQFRSGLFRILVIPTFSLATAYGSCKSLYPPVTKR